MKVNKLEYVILDAMGVIYTAGDDVGELLIPFLRARGCCLSDKDIQTLYMDCSLGRMTSKEFWESSGILYEETTDNEYILGHRLAPGLNEFLEAMADMNIRVACLSNDVSEWSVLLRKQHQLEGHIEHWLISGDLNARKPSEDIYKMMLEKLNTQPGSCLFLDDRMANLETAARLGIRTLLIDDPISTLNDDNLTMKHQTAPSLEKALKLIRLML
ncbi:HAD family hydrolase [Paenibacillus sp. NPDC058071]|uniref:HAD family hydrolase n=1 Tax=Paenibacillus sp. NPDC058071 TaxID=3346326 RepID=UPI0036DD2E7D